MHWAVVFTIALSIISLFCPHIMCLSPWLYGALKNTHYEIIFSTYSYIKSSSDKIAICGLDRGI